MELISVNLKDINFVEIVDKELSEYKLENKNNSKNNLNFKTISNSFQRNNRFFSSNI